MDTRYPLWRAIHRVRPAQIFVVGVFAATILMFILPRPYSTLTLFAVVLASARIMLDRPLHRALRWPSLSRLLVLGEIGLIIAASLYFARHYFDWDPYWTISGLEYSYLANSGILAGEFLRAEGTIPAWNPFLGRGEPLLEGPFSYIFNPLMNVGMMVLGGVHGGKVIIPLHIIIMGLGGWVLAWMLRLGTPGRVLLALLLAGSGSMAEATGGYFQMGLSQAYLPWVFAGVIGTLYRRERWPVALLAISAMLLASSGTYWYLLPAALSSAVLVLFGVTIYDEVTKTRHFNREGMRRVALAGILALGLSAVRLLPGAMNHAYIAHPPANLHLNPTVEFSMLVERYFTTHQIAFTASIYYHYVLPLSFAGFLLVLWLTLISRESVMGQRWRVLVPAVILILLYTAWAMEGTPVLLWFYNRISLLNEWRFLGRMMAVSSLWLVVLAAVFFDDIIRTLHRGSATNILRGTLLVIALGLAIFSTVDVMKNWGRVAGLDSRYNPHRPYDSIVHPLRGLHPGQFLSVLTLDFFSYLPFYETFTRAPFANPDVRAGAMEPTLGTRDVTRFEPRFAIGLYGELDMNLAGRGYVHVMELSPEYPPGLMYNPRTPGYAFITHISDVEHLADRGRPLTSNLTRPVDFRHRIDSVHITLDGSYHNGELLVITETAYPGWRVTINGEPAQLDVVGDLMALRLFRYPRFADDPPLEIVFSYHPVWLYRGGTLTVTFAVIIALYLLRAERMRRSGMNIVHASPRISTGYAVTVWGAHSRTNPNRNNAASPDH
jgi:hypothetical protein